MSRKDNIDYHWMPNGDIRAYDRTAADKRGISEQMVTSEDNISPTLVSARPPNVLTHE